MPDIFVPIDTSDVTDYLINVRNRGLIYRFSLNYSDNRRKELEKMTGITEIREYLKKNKAFESFISFAAENGVSPDWKEINESEFILKTQLNAFVGRTILDSEGYYPAIEPIDNALQMAIGVLTDG